MIKNSVLTGGTYFNAQTINYGTAQSGALKALTDAASPSAFHNSGLRHDPPKCHENTRVAVLKKLKDWVNGSDPETIQKWIMWLYGGAGAGKSAIGQTFTEKCDADERLLASFFFGRSDATRNQAKFLVPTIACQVYERIPGTRNKILSAIDNDPMIFNKTVFIQLELLVIEPLMNLQDTATRNVIIIDGRDECMDRSSQSSILRALFDVVQRPNCCLRFLVASRPEHDIVAEFSLQSNTTLGKLALDDKYQPLRDIERFLRDKIREIKKTHPFKSLIPQEWPGLKPVREIVEKSSGQFIYASIVVKFIASTRHRPDHRFDIVCNLRSPNGAMPFAELDALYTHILLSAEETPTVVELLSFVLHVSQLREDAKVTSLEEIHDLERGSLQLLLCDFGALVVINDEGVVKVQHASLLDFLLDPSRSKVLPISGNALMTKHIINCLRFLTKNVAISDRTMLSQDSMECTIQFLIRYLHRVPVFTVDMAEAFDTFSYLQLCQQAQLSINDQHRFLKWFNPVILELLRRSDSRPFLSRYLAMMDNSYLVLMDEYPPQTSALQISIMMHVDVFPRSALDLCFQLTEFKSDKLAILNYSDISENLGPTKANRSIFREFLLDPVRSRHHNFPGSDRRGYTMTLLACFAYLNIITFREDGSFYEAHLNTHADFSLSEKTLATGSGMVSENNRDKIILCTSEEYVITDSKKDIHAWRQQWDNELEPKGILSNLIPWCSLSDLGRFFQDDDLREHVGKITRGRYYLMLGYFIYFFPLAGVSKELINLCKITLLRKDPKLFPEQTASAQRAMGAYLRRMSNTMDSCEINTPRSIHLNISDPSTPSTVVDRQESRVTTTPSRSVNQDNVLHSTSTNEAGTIKKKTPKLSSTSAQIVSMDQRRRSPVRTSAKRGLEFLLNPSTEHGAKRVKNS